MKKLFRASHGRMSRRALLIVVVVLGATAATGLAATINQSSNNDDNTVIGTSGVADTISDGNGNDTIYGLGGGDTISAGNGNDQIDADGNCNGKQDVVGPPGLGNYCSHGQRSVSEGRSTITAGSRTGMGDDTIYGGSGPNTITGGNGNDTIYGGPIGDSISVGNGNDTIYLGRSYTGTTGYQFAYTGSTVSTGSGDDVIDAYNGVKDTISCGSKNSTTVYADGTAKTPVDVISGCAKVIYGPDPYAPKEPYPASDRRSLKHHSTQTHHTAKRKHTARRKHTAHRAWR